MMMPSRYIVSLEKIDNAFQFHILHLESLDVRTIQVRYVYRKQADFILQNLYNKPGLVVYFKEKYKLHHKPITISYGPMLNKFLREEKKKRRLY